MNLDKVCFREINIWPQDSWLDQRDLMVLKLFYRERRSHRGLKNCLVVGVLVVVLVVVRD